MSAPEPPDELVVLAHTYRVVVDRDGLLADAAVVRGHCAPERQVIGLDGELPRTALAVTLLHEVIHAALRTLHEEVLDPDAEELVARTLSEVLLLVLRANPRLVAYLTA